MEGFVLEETEEGKTLVGGYIINDKLIVPSSMTGGKRKNEEDESDYVQPKYAIPAGLYYIEVPEKQSSVEILYTTNGVLSDNIYDNLYENAMFVRTEEMNNKNNKNKNKITKKRKMSSNKKSRKQK